MPLDEKIWIFIAGLHRSGTSLVHEILREHPLISGLRETGVPEDEGQHLQSVIPAAIHLGGPGRFVFDPEAYMDESHPLATEQNARKMYDQWSAYYDLSCQYLIEKSPPNIVRTRFLQKLFPRCRIIMILRHPIAVSYATKKWSHTTVSSLLEHTIRAYEIFRHDMKYLNSIYVLRYEDFVSNPQMTIDDLCQFLGIQPVEVEHYVRADINEKYFSMWEKARKRWTKGRFLRVTAELEGRANVFGYSLCDVRRLLPVSWLGPHVEHTEESNVL